MLWEITTSRSYGAAAAGCGSVTTNALCDPAERMPAPTMMALGDFATYIAVLSAIGWVPLAVTTNLNDQFPEETAGTRPSGGSALAQARQTACGGRSLHPGRRR